MNPLLHFTFFFTS